MGKRTLFPLIDKKRLSPELCNLLTDKVSLSQYGTIQKYSKTQGVDVDVKQLKKVCHAIEKKLSDQFFQYTCLALYHAEVTGNWGQAGEQQSKTTFCRNLLKLKPTDPLDQDKAFSFITKTTELFNDYGFTKLSNNEVTTALKNYQFKFTFGTISIKTVSDINPILKFIGSDLYLYGSRMGDETYYILGEVDSYIKYDQEVMIIKEERSLTPNAVMSLAATNANNTIHIRNAVLENIFYQKWCQALQYPESEWEYIAQDPHRSISEGIKQETISLYQAKTVDVLSKHKNVFIQELLQTVLYHEIGHGIVQLNILDSKYGALAEASKRLSESILSTSLEFLADFAPQTGDSGGAMANMVTISKTNKAKATRMFYMYCSDTWFFDTEDTYMYLYSDMMALILLRYINEDKSINFTLLEQDLRFNKQTFKVGPKTIIDYAMSWFCEISDRIQEQFEKAPYKLVKDMDPIQYDQVRSLTVQDLLKKGLGPDTETYTFQTKLWMVMFENAKRFTTILPEVERLLDEGTNYVLKELFVLVAGDSTAANYNYENRRYVIDRFSELGIKATSPLQ